MSGIFGGGRTPDEFPGERYDESIQLLPVSSSLPSINGEIYYVENSVSGSGFFFQENGETKRLHQKVLVSPTDTTSGYLKDKIYSSVVINSGSNEQILILNSGSTVPATQVGQVLFSVDGVTFGAYLPVTTYEGWLVQDEGVHIVVG